MNRSRIVACLLSVGIAVSAGCAAEVAPFAEWCAAAADGAGKVIKGTDGWLFLPGEARFLGVGPFWGESAADVGRARKPEHRDPLPAILDTHRQLAARGIPLLLVPVPPRTYVCRDRLGASDAAVADMIPPAYRAFYDVLRKEGVSVLDLTDAFAAAHGDDEASPCCRTDTHWSGRGIAIAAEAIADRLRAEAGIEKQPPDAFAVESRETPITGDLARMAGAAGAGERETVRLDFVRGRETGEPVPPDPASPVLLLGDSHVLVFHAGADLHAAGAGLPDRLAVELGRPVALVGVRDSGATMARMSLFRRLRNDPGALDGKRAVVWCFAAREFTEADGWRKIPLGVAKE